MWTNLGLLKFTEEILNGKLYFLCAVSEVVVGNFLKKSTKSTGKACNFTKIKTSLQMFSYKFG